MSFIFPYSFFSILGLFSFFFFVLNFLVNECFKKMIFSFCSVCMCLVFWFEILKFGNWEFLFQLVCNCMVGFCDSHVKEKKKMSSMCFCNKLLSNYIVVN